ncbi:MAG: phosphodiester glycosidase family protein [Clostridia bacterium]|nr:phosphodiester glycosidase family protein [Clostridia bacterium]
MRNGVTKGIAALLAIVMLCGCAAFAEDATREEVEVLELPEADGGEFAILTPSEDPSIGPHESGYLFEEGEKSPYAYVDPSISVNIGRGRIYKTNYIYARVKIASPAQIRTMMSSESLSKKVDVMGHLLAKRVKAVVAVSGVLLADDMMKGPVVLQGDTLRPDEKTSENKLEKWKNDEAVDTLVIDEAGDLHILEGETWNSILEQLEKMGGSAVNVLAFGPALVVDGEARYGYTNRQTSTHRKAQRMAICQTGPLEYMLIASEGPEDLPDKNGLTLDQFTELIASFPDVKTAYNLDGGSSSTLIFRKGKEYWAKINGSTGKKRQIRDIIYFADAWLPDTETNGQ